MFPSITYKRRADIDIAKWDACISAAPNGLIYSYSWYLDHMAKNWDALVTEDYSMVMPLPWNKKYGFHYLYQPAFTASLGISGRNIDQQTTAAFLQAIPSRFRIVEISLNHANKIKDGIPGVFIKTNYTLDLAASYDTLRNDFSQNIIRNSQKALNSGCTYEKNIPLENITTLSRDLLKKISPVREKDYKRFNTLYMQLQSQDRAITRGVYNSRHVLMAAAVFFFSHHRAYYILVGNHPNGKTIGASHFLLDRFINEFAGSSLLLDFEGSDLKSLAFFYSSFGADTELFPALKWNRLPWGIRWMK